MYRWRITRVLRRPHGPHGPVLPDPAAGHPVGRRARRRCGHCRSPRRRGGHRGAQPHPPVPRQGRLVRDSRLPRVLQVLLPQAPCRRRLAGTTRAAALARGLGYIQQTPEIRDVLITGGDPLVLPDEVLEDLLRKIRAIPHVEIIRIGTRAPATLPQRITPELCSMLRRAFTRCGSTRTSTTRGS